ncbi:MAG: hypothetical protein KDD51_08910 [Bdellovibrionales bacterium]|nr:hypothetical protein [Bdellovibrionales bacterium]
MEMHKISLSGSVRRYRRNLWERILAVEMLQAFLECGFELRYACSELKRHLGPLPGVCRVPTCASDLFDGRGLPTNVQDALSVLEALYEEGRPVRAVLGQLSDLLLNEYQAATEDFAKRLPARMGGFLLVFFLPPALLLLLAPLCVAFTRLY